jgi:hypothetical protein
MQIEHVIGLILVAVIFHLAAISIRALELIFHAPIHAVLGLPTGGGASARADDVVGDQGESIERARGREQTLLKEGKAVADLGHVGGDGSSGPGLVGARSIRTANMRATTADPSQLVEGKSSKDIILGVSRSVDSTGDHSGLGN